MEKTGKIFLYATLQCVWVCFSPFPTPLPIDKSSCLLCTFVIFLYLLLVSFPLLINRNLLFVCLTEPISLISDKFLHTGVCAGVRDDDSVWRYQRLFMANIIIINSVTKQQLFALQFEAGFYHILARPTAWCEPQHIRQ